jgi:hypothetical protein
VFAAPNTVAGARIDPDVGARSVVGIGVPDSVK